MPWTPLSLSAHRRWHFGGGALAVAHRRRHRLLERGLQAALADGPARARCRRLRGGVLLLQGLRHSGEGLCSQQHPPGARLHHSEEHLHADHPRPPRTKFADPVRHCGAADNHRHQEAAQAWRRERALPLRDHDARSRHGEALTDGRRGVAVRQGESLCPPLPLERLPLPRDGHRQRLHRRGAGADSALLLRRQPLLPLQRTPLERQWRGDEEEACLDGAGTAGEEHEGVPHLPGPARPGSSHHPVGCPL
mmetsp:Transcript_6183/g.24928  ORF Transcript_6183/g.24928 Transcript_6183/m.24928 type:complete len:250 (+) Transcript_6183:1265-2014(+)